MWTGTTNVATSSGVLAINTKFTATIVSGAPAGFIYLTTVGIVPGAQAVAEIIGATFKVNYLMEAAFASGGAYQPISNSLTACRHLAAAPDPASKPIYREVFISRLLLFKQAKSHSLPPFRSCLWVSVQWVSLVGGRSGKQK